MKIPLRLSRAALSACASLILAFASFAVLNMGAAAQGEGSATVTTDKDDYSPGEIVYITGRGFAPGEPIDLSIAIEDADGLWIPDVDWTVGFAEADGGFEAEYVVPEHWAGKTLRLTAMGYDSGLIATVTFTDSVLLAQVVSPTTGSPVTVTSLPAIVTVSFRYATSGGGTISATASIPSVASATKPLAGGGSVSSPLSDSIQLTIPSGTANGTYNLNFKVDQDGGTGGPKSVTDNHNGAVIVSVPSCPTNAAPSLEASNFVAGEVCAGVPQTFTVSPADFVPVVSDPDGDPVVVTFDDGTTSKQVTFNVGDPSATFTIKATDNPTGRNVSGCPALQPQSVTKEVTVSYVVHESPPQTAPTITASDLDLGHICVEEEGNGVDVVRQIAVGDFNPVTSDAEGDPVSVALSQDEVTLTLPLGESDKQVEVEVTLTATDDPSGRNDPLCPALVSMSSSVTVKVKATLHRNNAPTIEASDANLGQIVGCLMNGSFQTTQPISLATFGASASDPDGDPVELSISGNIGQLTFVGPGVVTLPVELSATDDPSNRTAGTCDPKTTTKTVNVTVQVVYNFVGFGSPLNNAVATKVKRGSAVPVKFQLFDCNMTPITTGQHEIKVLYCTAAVPNGEVEIDDAGMSNDNGVFFRYADTQWIYNLKTNTSYSLGSTYIIRACLDDGTKHDVKISIK